MTAEIDLIAALDALGPAIAERAPMLDETDAFAAESYADFRAHRLFSALVPTACGGGGATHRDICDFLRRLARLCPSTALALAMHQHLVAAAAANDRAGRPGRALLEKVGHDELILVSTGANDWLDSNGTARRVKGGFRVSAVKPFASGSPMGDVMITSAAYDDPAEGAQVLHFALPIATDGVTLMDDWRTLGMRGTGSQTIRIDDAFVPEAAITLRRPRGPFHPAFAMILTVAMPLIMSVYTGIAEAAAGIARDRAKAGDLVALDLGEMETRLTTAQIATADMVRLANDLDFQPSTELANRILMRKTIAAKASIGTVDAAVAAIGGSAMFRRTGFERLWRDVQGARFHPLTAIRQQSFSGRLATGLAPVPEPAAARAATAA